ncbi:hypothetical protein HRbin37_00883 [bacterium HR37]|nr:hypothetical protein HRbin37_00883 [bacterium HR37]
MDSNSKKALDSVLTAIKKKQKTRKVLNALTKVIFVAIIAQTAVCLLSNLYSDPLYFSILKILFLTIVLLGIFKLVLPEVRENPMWVLELERLYPGLGEDTLNAILLAGELENKKRVLVSPSLIKAHIKEVINRLSSVDISKALPQPFIRTNWKASILLVVISIASVLLSPAEFRKFLLSTRIVPPSEPYELELADIEIEYRYPAYTGIKPSTLKGSTGDIYTLKGTMVTFKATPLANIKEGKMVFKDNLEIPFNLENGRLKAEFLALSESSFFLEDSKGKFRSKTFKLAVKEDKVPDVKIESPFGDNIELDTNEKLDIRYEAKDDFGLTKVLLVWKTNGVEETKILEAFKKPIKSTEGNYTLYPNLINNGIDTNESIEVFVKVYDNDTISGPKVAVSKPLRITLKKPSEEHKESIKLAEKALNSFLDLLADSIEKRPEQKRYYSEKEISDIVDIQSEITVNIDKAKDLLYQLLDKMRHDRFSDYTYFVGVSNMVARIEELLDERKHVLSSFFTGNISRLDGLITREINEFEEDILFLDSMLRKERLKESILYGRESLKGFERLSDLVKDLKNRNRDTKSQITKQVEELRKLISGFIEKLSSISSRGEYEGFLNADAFDNLDLDTSLDELMKLLEEDRIEEALTLLSKLKEQLELTLASIERGFQSLSSTLLSKEISQLEELIHRIRGLEEAQKALKKETEDFKASVLRGQSKNKDLNDFTQKTRIEQLKNNLKEASNKLIRYQKDDRYAEGSLLTERLVQMGEELKNLIETSDFNKATQTAEDMVEGLNTLKNLSNLGIGNTEEIKAEISGSLEIAQSVLRELKNLKGKRNPNNETTYLAKKQGDIERETSKLEIDIEDSKYSSGFLTPETKRYINESRDFMRRAQRNLTDKEVSKAISNQEEAIKSLQKAQKEAKELLDKHKLSAQGMGLPVPLVLGKRQSAYQGEYGGLDTSHIDIPPPEDTGKWFKENILRSFKEGSPEGYSELNRRYLERIIK